MEHRTQHLVGKLHSIGHIKKSETLKKSSQKTYNSGYSPVVTHLTTNPPVEGLTRGERTGSSEFLRLWSYVEEVWLSYDYIDVDVRCRRCMRYTDLDTAFSDGKHRAQ